MRRIQVVTFQLEARLLVYLVLVSHGKANAHSSVEKRQSSLRGRGMFNKYSGQYRKM